MVTVSTVTASQAKADAYLVGVVTKDDKKSAPGLALVGLDKNAHAKRLLTDKKVGIGPKSVHTVATDDGFLLLVGLGDIEKLTQEKLGSAVNAGLRAAKGLGLGKVATTLLLDSGMDAKVAGQALAHGAIIGALDFDHYKSKKDDKKTAAPDLQVIADSKGLAGVRSAVKDAATIAEAVNDARLLANTPGNIANPKWVASEARKRGKKHGFKVSVKGRAQLKKEGYGGLNAVGQGSDNEEQLIVMDYHPQGAKKTFVVVGKSVTFDSGGISLKPGNLMWEMKYDKCGGMNVLGIMTALKDLGFKHRVVGIVPAAENMPSGSAQRPGDIITMKDGTTVEVLNTDAEGRLILGDAITHGTTFKPQWMCDMATLTGACEVAVGHTHVAIMSKDDALAQSFVDASRRAGDKGWQLPQGEEFDEANKATYADIQNIALTNKAGTATAGAFVSHFAKDTPFVHLDIAAKAWTKGIDYFGNGPSGAGVRIVLQRLLDE